MDTVRYDDLDGVRPIADHCADIGVTPGKNADSMEVGTAGGETYFVKEGRGVVASHLVADVALSYIDAPVPDIRYDPASDRVLLSSVGRAMPAADVPPDRYAAIDVDRNMQHRAVAVELFLGLPDPVDNTTVTPDGAVHAVDLDQTGYAALADIDVDGYLEEVDRAFRPFGTPPMDRSAIAGHLDGFASRPADALDTRFDVRYRDVDPELRSAAEPYLENVRSTVRTLRR